MSLFTQPKDNTLYRIQNVDSGLYLERRIDEVVMRPDKMTKTYQHWKFVVIPGTIPVTYQIEEAYPASNSVPDILHVDTTGTTPELKIGPVAPSTTGIQDRWFFHRGKLDAKEKEMAYFLARSIPPPGTAATRYQALSADRTGFTFFSVNPGGERQLNRESDFYWQVAEVTPAALPETDNNNKRYRIRAVLGKPLQVDTSATPFKVNLDLEDRRGDHRAWTLEDLGNGKCTVQHIGTSGYLTRESRNSRWWPVVKAAQDVSAENRIWIFERTTEITYSIFFAGTEWALALEESDAILKPKKPAHNQVWLVEPADAPMPDLNPNQQTGTAQSPSGYPPGLREGGKYTLRTWNTQPPCYLRLLTEYNYGRQSYDYSYRGSTSQANSTTVWVERVANGFVIYGFSGTQRYYVVVLGTNVGARSGNVNSDGDVWALQSAGNNEYFIVAPSGQVICAPVSPTDTGVTLTLEPRSTNAASNQRQRWQFV